MFIREAICGEFVQSARAPTTQLNYFNYSGSVLLPAFHIQEDYQVGLFDVTSCMPTAIDTLSRHCRCLVL